MMRKGRTEPFGSRGEGSQSEAQRPTERPPQPAQQLFWGGAGNRGRGRARGWAQPPQFGSRGGYGGRGGHQQGFVLYQQPQREMVDQQYAEARMVPQQYSQSGMASQHHLSPLDGYQGQCAQPRQHSQLQPQRVPFQQPGCPMLRSDGDRRRGDPMIAGDGGPYRTPVPEIHQATSQVSYQAIDSQAELPSWVNSSVTTDEASSSHVIEQFQQLSFQSESASIQESQPVAPSIKSIRGPSRPGKGSMGTRYIVKANHFFAEIQCRDLYHYDVSIVPEVPSRTVNKAIMQTLVDVYKASNLGNRLPVYDGRKSLYTAGELPFTSKEFKITLPNEDSGSAAPRRERSFKVFIRLASHIDLHHLEMFLQGNRIDVPQDALQVLDIVLRELPSKRFTSIGRSFYSPKLGKRQPLGEGLESWRGFYQSIRPTQMGLTLNIDISSNAFIEPLPIIQFVAQLLNRDISSGPPSDRDCLKIRKALKAVKVEVTHHGNTPRKYRISEITSQGAHELIFPANEQGTMKSVFQYFQETYGIVIKHTSWPCLQVGNPRRPKYLPMEVCKIAEGQRYSKKLNEKEITALLKVTCQRPTEREKNIAEMVHHNDYENDQYAKEFGITISKEFASVEARVLPAPQLKYHDKGKVKDCLPQIGQWNMMNKKLVNGGAVHNWTCINFSRNVQDKDANDFCSELSRMCQISGMVFSNAPVLSPFRGRPDQVESLVKACFHEVMAKLCHQEHKELDLLIAILPDNNGPLYGELKRICETDLGIISQCCLTKQVFKLNKQYLANLALKINVKVGGRNCVLADALSRRMPLVSSKPTIIFGADVTHPHPGEDSSPSIAAVVASQDWPEITKYAGLVSAQTHREEIIQDLFNESEHPVKGRQTGGMIKELLISFYRATGQKPEQIIFYRDGVSEGQFYQVLFHELDKIRQACASLQADYQPPVTFIVVQKRHHTRLFTRNHGDRNSTDRSGNILPGTVVDTKICHPREFDFYLCSHAGIQGTSRPAHYHVLYDENNFTADGLQILTNNLCYTYARCTRSVSIVPPVYYAHLAAFRAHFYMEPGSDSGLMPSGSAGRGAGGRGRGRSTGRGADGEGVQFQGRGAGVKPLPSLKDNVKRVMFYC